MILTSVPPQVFFTNSSNLELRGRPSIKTIPLSNKPAHVLWTSTYRPEAHHICAWQAWCEINLFPYGRNSFLITPRKNLKVFRPTDIEELHLLPHQEEFLSPDLRESIFPLVDYNWYAQQGYDGFHIEAQDTILGEFWENGKIRLSPFRSWDCESTCWFHYDWIQLVEKIH